jgi:hypothetical protein
MKSMKNIFRLVVTLLLLAGWGLAASALHVVRNGSKLAIVPKDRIGARETYVDASHWTANEVAAHPVVVKRLIAAGKTDVLAPAFKASSNEELVAQIEEAIARGPTTQPTPTPVEKVEEKVEQVVDKAKEAAGHAKGAVQ